VVSLVARFLAARPVHLSRTSRSAGKTGHHFEKERQFSTNATEIGGLWKVSNIRSLVKEMGRGTAAYPSAVIFTYFTELNEPVIIDFFN
jgi:hypothetical protein